MNDESKSRLSEMAFWLRGMRVMTYKELIQLVRDVPLLLFMIYTFTINVYMNGSSGGIQLERSPTVVHNDDHSLSSRELIHRFRTPYFYLLGEIERPEEGLEMLDSGQAMVVVDIPPQFERSILQGSGVNVQVQVDATMTMQSFLAASYAEQIATEYALELAQDKLPVATSLPQIEDDHRLWFNPNENHQWFNPITELANVITIFCILLPAAAMAREKERGTIEQLMVSPLSPTQILAPKIIAMTIVILIGTALSLSLIMPTLQIPLRGSLFLFFAVTAFYVITMTGFGILAGTIARNMGQVGMLAMLILLPMIIMSGIFTPLEGKPMWFNGLSALVPLKYYFEIALGIFLKGAGLGVLWPQVLWLIVLGASILGLGRWMFRRQFE